GPRYLYADEFGARNRSTASGRTVRAEDARHPGTRKRRRGGQESIRQEGPAAQALGHSACQVERRIVVPTPEEKDQELDSSWPEAEGGETNDAEAAAPATATATTGENGEKAAERPG